ncbi:hypothetical protein NMG60_11033433 [Bertholletia excelsa]
MGRSNQGFCDQEQQPRSSDSIGTVSCTTFNILAPIYKRLNGKNCESEFREIWLGRNISILDGLLNLSSSIICLQEFWVHNEELVKLYDKRLGDAGYVTYKLARTNNRGDGLLTAVHQSHFHVLNHQEFLFNDIGDRVAQLLHLELLVPSSQSQYTGVQKDVLLVNTHLIFPHDSSYCFVRLQQVCKILHYLDSYCHEHQLPCVPIILCGDWNGSKKGNVYKFLESQGFVSSYDIAHPCTDEHEEISKWISHHNHRGNACGVDFIWLRNPSKPRRPLKESFTEAVVGNIKLGLTNHPEDGLTTEEIKDLWEHMDTNGDGFIDSSDFARAWNPCTLVQPEEDGDGNRKQTEEPLDALTVATGIGFNVSKAMFLPSEVEMGMWPENYSLSDHAQLTVEFSVVKL